MEKLNSGKGRLSEEQIERERNEDGKTLEEDFKLLEKAHQEQINVIVDIMRSSLIGYLHRPKAEPRMLNRVKEFNNQLCNSLYYASDAGSNTYKNLDLEAALVGARVVIAPSMESRSPNDLDPNLIEPIKHFVRLVNSRTRRIVEKQ